MYMFSYGIFLQGKKKRKREAAAHLIEEIRYVLEHACGPNTSARSPGAEVDEKLYTQIGSLLIVRLTMLNNSHQTICMMRDTWGKKSTRKINN